MVTISSQFTGCLMYTNENGFARYDMLQKISPLSPVFPGPGWMMPCREWYVKGCQVPCFRYLHPLGNSGYARPLQNLHHTLHENRSGPSGERASEDYNLNLANETVKYTL